MVEPILEEDSPLPHQLPTLSQAPGADRLSRDAQWRRLPRYGKDDYRWHEIRLSAPGEPTTLGVATNILGHEVIGWPPDKVFGPVWRMWIDGVRWGRGVENFEEAADRFHTIVVPRLEPIGVTRIETTPASIEAARAGVRERKARTDALAEVARSADVEVCPQAVFELDPVPETHTEIRARAKQYQDIVKRFRALHRVELYAAGKLAELPEAEFAVLNGGGLHKDLRRDLFEPENRMQAVAWARRRYESWLKIAGKVLAPTDAKNAARVLDTCVRDVETGSRRLRLERATQLREHERQRQRSRSAPTSTVVAPISAEPSEPAVPKKRAAKKPTTPEPAPAAAPAQPEAPAKKPAAKKKRATKKKRESTPAPVKPQAPAKKPAAKKKSRKPKKPSWRYTVHQDVRHRFRELDGAFVVERSTADGWVSATATAAKSIHAKSESACALAARILPTCGPQRPSAKRRALRPSAAEKDAMRRLLGL